MPNTYLKPEQRIELVLAELYKASNLSNLVTRFNGDRFRGALNDTLIYETQGITVARDYEFRSRNLPVVFDEIYKNQLPITLNKHMTVGNKWTDEEQTLDLTSFRREIAIPMANALVTRYDAKILAALRAANWAVTDLNVTAVGDEEGKTAFKKALSIKKKLDTAGCPPQGRYLVLGANAFAWFAGSGSVKEYDSAQALTAFREGVFGRIAAMEVVDGSQIIGENEIIVVHPSWGVLANVAPDNPQGAVWSARSSFEGYAARLLLGYSVDYLSDRAVLSSFWGISEINDQYQRWTAADIGTATDGSEVGDVKIADGKPLFTNFNVRGGKGTFTPSA